MMFIGLCRNETGKIQWVMSIAQTRELPTRVYSVLQVLHAHYSSAKIFFIGPIIGQPNLASLKIFLDW